MLAYEALISESLTAQEEKTKPILIVEDDRGLRMIFEWMVRDIDPNLTFDWCTTAEEARKALEKNRYRLIISDFMLDGFENGLDVWEVSNRTYPRAKFVMMSSLQLQKFAQVTGPGGYTPELVTKPIDVNQMQKIIREAVGPKEAK